MRLWNHSGLERRRDAHVCSGKLGDGRWKIEGGKWNFGGDSSSIASWWGTEPREFGTQLILMLYRPQC